MNPLEQSKAMTPELISLVFPPSLLVLKDWHNTFETTIKHRWNKHNSLTHEIGDCLSVVSPKIHLKFPQIIPKLYPVWRSIRRGSQRARSTLLRSSTNSFRSSQRTPQKGWKPSAWPDQSWITQGMSSTSTKGSASRCSPTTDKISIALRETSKVQRGKRRRSNKEGARCVKSYSGLC